MATVLREKGMTEEEFAQMIPTLDHLMEGTLVPSGWFVSTILAPSPSDTSALSVRY